VCGVVGPNGAGKTSLFNCVSGLYRPDSGQILIGGADALRLAPHQRIPHGVTLADQGAFAKPGTRVLWTTD
jgi:branched-chain amino acid transport system ATP-binding protein